MFFPLLPSLKQNAYLPKFTPSRRRWRAVAPTRIGIILNVMVLFRSLSSLLPSLKAKGHSRRLFCLCLAPLFARSRCSVFLLVKASAKQSKKKTMTTFLIQTVQPEDPFLLAVITHRRMCAARRNESKQQINQLSNPPASRVTSCTGDLKSAELFALFLSLSLSLSHALYEEWRF